MFKNILMPTDGSEHSERAVARGVELAKLCGAKVTGMHVLPDYRLIMAFADEVYADPVNQQKAENDARTRAADFLEFVCKAAAAAGVACETVIATNDHPYDAIVNVANERGCDLIVMTSRYRKGLASLIMSSQSERVLHRASIPVLMFRALVSADHPDKAAMQRAALLAGKAHNDGNAKRVRHTQGELTCHTGPYA